MNSPRPSWSADTDRPLEEIDAVLAALDAQGLRVDAEQRVRLVALILELAANRQLPADVPALCRLLTPILARTPDQQALCRTTFNAVYGGEMPPASGDEISSSAAKAQDASSGKTFRWQSWLLRGLLGCFIAIALSAALYAFLHSSYWAPPPVPGNFVDSTPPPSGTVPKFDWIKNYPVDEYQPPVQSPWNRSWRWYYTEFDTSKWLAVLLPWAAYLAFMALLYHQLLGQLRREALKQNLRALDWRLNGVNAPFGDRSLIGDLQPLRTVARAYLRRFDLESTVMATAASAGLFQARYRDIAVPADFVVFIDRQSPRDHLAAYYAEVVRSLTNAGLLIEVLEFNRDPSLCSFVRSGTFMRLEAAVGRFPDSILLLCAAAEQLVDPVQAGLLPAVKSLKDARRVVLLTPESEGGETPLERALVRRLGLSIIRTTPAGIRKLVDLLNQEGSKGGTKPGHRHGPTNKLTALTEFFSDRPGRWMQAAIPSRADRRELRENLVNSLEPGVLRLLAATAVYPELRPPLTLSLKLATGEQGRFEPLLGGELLSVLKLPWFRNGWMPDWTRTLLLQVLARVERTRIRDVIFNSMTGTGRQLGTDSDATRIGVEGDRQPDAKPVRADMIMLDYILPSFKSSSGLFAVPRAWLRKILRKPLHRLAVVAVLMALVTATASVGALALVPINECDLLAGSRLDNLRMGPVTYSDWFSVGDIGMRARSACWAATTMYPQNGRYWFQLWRTFASDPVRHRAAERSAQSGYPIGFYALALDFQRGIGVTASRDKAIFNYQKAVDLGDPAGLIGLAIIASQGKSKSDLKNAFDKFNRYYAAGGTDIRALAEFYNDNPAGVVPRDMAKYREILEEGVRRGDSDSALGLGFYLLRTDTGKDMRRGNELYALCFHLSFEGTCASNLAMNYRDGAGVPVDMAMATHWAIMGAKANNTTAMKTLVDLFASGRARFEAGHSPLDIDPIGFLRSMASDDDDRVQYQLGRALERTHNTSEAISWYRKAALQGDSDAIAALRRLKVGPND